MDFLRGLALAGQEYISAKQRQQARADVLKQQAFENWLREEGLGLQRQDLTSVISGRERSQALAEDTARFNQGMATRQADWTEGEPGRARAMAEFTADLQRRTQQGLTSDALANIFPAVVGPRRLPQNRVELPPPPEDILSKLLTPTAEVPQALPQPAMVPQSIPLQVPIRAQAAPTAEDVTMAGEAAPAQASGYAVPLQAAPSARVRTKTTRPMASTQVAQPRNLARYKPTDEEMLEEIGQIPGFGMTTGPGGATFELRRPTKGEEAATGLTLAQTDRIRQEIDQAAAFLPGLLKGRDLENDLRGVQLGLAQFDLGTVKPMQAQELQKNLDLLDQKLELAKKTNPLMVDQLREQIAKMRAETYAIGQGLALERGRLDVQRGQLAVAQGQLALERSNSAARNATEAARTDIYRQSVQPRPAGTDPRDVQAASNDIGGKWHSLMSRIGNAQLTGSGWPSTSEFDLIIAQANDLQSMGLLPAATADAYRKMATEFKAGLPAMMSSQK